MKIILSLAKRVTLVGVLVTRWLAYPSGVTEVVGSTLTLPSNNNNNNNNDNNCLLIDMSIPTEKNTSVKVTEKLSKYKDLEIEIEQMWGMKATTIPVVIGALGLIKKGLEKYTKQIPGNIKISQLQKIALLGTSRILRKTLSIKTSTSF